MVSTFYWLYTTYFLTLVLLLPSAVAFVVDRSPKKFLFRCVLAVNICGALPAIIRLWVDGRSVGALTDILSNVWYWVYAYGAAAVGWSLFTGVPPLIGKFVAMRAGRRIQELRRRQEELREEWGDEVAQEVRMQAAEGLDGLNPDELDDLGDLDDLDGPDGGAGGGGFDDDMDDMSPMPSSSEMPDIPDPADNLDGMNDDAPPVRPGAAAAAG